MAVSENDLVVGPLVPAAGVTTISLDFYFEQASWLEVYKSGSETPLVLNTDYTVAGAGSSSGVVTLTAAANGIDAYSIYLAVPLQRSSDMQLRGEFKSEPFNIEMDRLWQALQGLNTQVGRSVRLPKTSTAIAPLLPVKSTGYALAWGEDGNLVNAPINVGDIANDLIAAQAARDGAEAAQEAAENVNIDVDVALSAANAARDKAQQWAEEVEDTEVETGAYSAKHHRAKAEDAQTASVAAQAASEAARDAAFINANVYADIATGRAAVANGEQFAVVSSDGREIIRYRRDSSSTETEVARFPSVNAVLNPVRTGRINGALDTFFRYLTPTISPQAGKKRFRSSNDLFAALENQQGVSPYDGGALVKTATGTGALEGIIYYLSEIGAGPGDTVTLKFWVIATEGSPVVYYPARSLDNAGVPIGTQYTPSPATLTATPVVQLVTHEIVVMEGAESIYVYPYHNTTGAEFATVAHAFYKGNAEDTPDTPPMSDEDLARVRLNVLEEVIGDAPLNRLDALAGAVDYAFITTTEVEADATVNNLAVSGASAGVARNLPFSGWGEVYDPAGISFNAIRARFLTRSVSVVESAYWGVIKAVVRTGATPHASGSTLIAVGETIVDPNIQTLTNVDIILRDPVSGEVKTLTDADFSGGKYFIGLYARTASGGYAAISEHIGTMSNSAGQSYYVTTANPLTGTWSTNSGNNRLGVDHLLLTNPVDVEVYSPTQDLRDALQTDPVTTPAFVKWAPPKIYLTAGLETSIYFDNLIAADFQDYFWGTAGYARGKHQHERWTFNLTDALASSVAGASIQIYDKVSENPIAQITFDFVASVAGAGNGTTPVCLFIGDSLTNAGYITQTLLDLAAADVMGLTLIGTRGVAPNLHQGRGGYRIDDYATAGRTYYAFTVSGVSVAPAINSTQYSHDGSVYLVQEVDLTGGAGTITCSLVSGGAPLSSGTLTKTFGSGDDSIAFSASAAISGNPFWIGGQVDFGQWLTDNSFPAPNWVFIALGTNDTFGQTSDAGVAALATSEFAKLDVLIASIKAADAGTKIALIPPPPPSASQDAFGTSYGAAYRRWRVKRNYILWAAVLVEEYAGREGERIFICPAGLNWDTENNASRTTSAPINSRSSVMVERQNNGVHPPAAGYAQIADAIWAFLKCQA